MRQKDVNQLAAIWAIEVRDADVVELPGLEAAIGSVIRPLRYASNPAHPLDLSPLETLVRMLRERQSKPPVIRDCHADGLPV